MKNRLPLLLPLLFAAPLLGAAPLVRNGGFEAFVDNQSTDWTQTSIINPYLICVTGCVGGIGARTGSSWVWFGSDEAEEGSVEQVGEIPVGTKTLDFYFWWSSHIDQSVAASFTVRMDGNAIFSLNQDTAPFYVDGGIASEYTLISVDISAYADGNSHTLRFEESNAASSHTTDINVDDVHLAGSPLVQDGGFEAGPGPTDWKQTSLIFPYLLCYYDGCVGVGPHTGTYWALFGDAGTAAEQATIEEVGEIPVGWNTLTFYLWWSSSVVTPYDPSAMFKVSVDGNTVFSLTPATAGAYSAAYTRAAVDISAYADGTDHTLRFEETNAAGGGSTSINLDDVNISDKIFSAGFEP